jgi:glucose-1-phosphate cytidylyltransferase
LTAVQPPGRYGALAFSSSEGELVKSFQEKPEGEGGWINGGFFVLEPTVFDYIRQGDQTTWEREPMEQLARDSQLAAYRHAGFWHAMDTLRDKNELERLWNSGSPPWGNWNK